MDVETDVLNDPYGFFPDDGQASADTPEVDRRSRQDATPARATGESSEMKVLRRLVAPRMDGTYIVPNEIIEKFKDIAGGGRAEVLQLFRKHNGDKDTYRAPELFWYKFILRYADPAV
eukprot:s2260_g8.t1